jgi:serine/threonine-protein kinase
MTQEPLIGRTIAGKYEIELRVGEGAMGAVYKARQLTLGTTVALKVLHGQLAGEPTFAARFLREAQAASRVDHPSSMRVIDFGEEPDGLLYIAMEYIDGRTLAKLLEERGPLPVARIVDIAGQALAALAVAHDLGVIHRDLKPENLMLVDGTDDEGRHHDIVKVCDFGVAKLLQGGARAPSVTAEGLVVGTPEYMSPEQARGEALDARSDLYAMGVLLFQMMTGKVPFDSSTAFGTALMHVTDEPTRPRLLNPKVDSRLEKICLKAMKKRPDERYSSARELRAELRALLGHDDAYADEAGDAPPGTGVAPGSLLAQIEARPRRSGLLMAGVVAVVTVGAFAYLFPRGGQAPAAERMQTTTIASAVMPSAARAEGKAAGAASPGEATAAGAAGADATSVVSTPTVRGRGTPKVNARRGAIKARAGAAGEAVPMGVLEDANPEGPPLPGPDANATTDANAATGKADANATADANAASGKADANAASGKADANAKPASAKPARAGRPAGKASSRPASADPAAAPLPVFPVPSQDAPAPAAPPPPAPAP